MTVQAQEITAQRGNMTLFLRQLAALMRAHDATFSLDDDYLVIYCGDTAEYIGIDDERGPGEIADEQIDYRADMRERQR